MNTHVRLLLLVTVLVALSALPVHAQRTSGAFGAGAQFGEPTGVTLKVFNERKPSYDFLAAWSFQGDTSVFLSGHALWNHDINASNIDQDLEWFVGPGAFVTIGDEPADDDEFGASVAVGVNLILNQRFELFVQAVPRLALVPDTEGDIGGGLGARYYF